MSWGKQTKFHRCPAFGCQKDVPNKLLMCFAHWKIVPAALQDVIVAQWKYGVHARCHPTQAYTDALREALVHVRGVLEARDAKKRAKNFVLGMQS